MVSPSSFLALFCEEEKQEELVGNDKNSFINNRDEQAPHANAPAVLEVHRRGSVTPGCPSAPQPSMTEVDGEDLHLLLLDKLIWVSGFLEAT